MKKYSYRKLLIILFMLNLFAIAVFYIKYCKSQLPNTIHIKKGEKISLCYNVPASATINNQKIKLNRTFIFQKCSSGQYEMKTSLFGAIPLKKIKVKVVDGQKVIPSGQVVGIYVETNGLLVIDTDGFTGENGVDHAQAKINCIVGIILKR